MVNRSQHQSASGKPQILADLVDAAARIAVHELEEDGKVTTAFVAADLTGKLTVLGLPTLSTDYLRSMIMTYCGAFDTEMYAVTCVMHSQAVLDQTANKTESVVITACTRSESLVYFRDIIPGPTIKLSEPQLHQNGSGSFVGLLPKYPVTQAQRTLCLALWQSSFAPMYRQTYIDPAIGRN